MVPKIFMDLSALDNLKLVSDDAISLAICGAMILRGKLKILQMTACDSPS